ncbi:MAG: hypothetical protein QM749_09480 [Aquabacterium sp.]
MLYRLNVFPIELPPLRDRLDDIPLIAEHFLSEISRREGQFKRFSPQAVQRLKPASLAGQCARTAQHRAPRLRHGTRQHHHG